MVYNCFSWTFAVINALATEGRGSLGTQCAATFRVPVPCIFGRGCSRNFANKQPLGLLAPLMRTKFTKEHLSIQFSFRAFTRSLKIWLSILTPKKLEISTKVCHPFFLQPPGDVCFFLVISFIFFWFTTKTKVSALGQMGFRCHPSPLTTPSSNAWSPPCRSAWNEARGLDGDGWDFYSGGCFTLGVRMV